MNKRIYIFILSTILMSCGIKKIVKTDFLEPLKTPKQIIERVNATNNYPEFLNLKGKLSLLQENQEITLNITIKNKKDSIIWLSVGAVLGIEIIRAQLTPDSIYFINRTNKTYLVKKASYIKELINLELSFYDIQDIITANPKILKKQYKTESNESNYFLYTDNYNYVISKNYRVQKIKIKDKKGVTEFSFHDFKEEQNFPTNISLKSINKEIKINYSKIEFNNPKKITFQIPESYAKTE